MAISQQPSSGLKDSFRGTLPVLLEAVLRATPQSSLEAATRDLEGVLRQPRRVQQPLQLLAHQRLPLLAVAPERRERRSLTRRALWVELVHLPALART